MPSTETYSLYTSFLSVIYNPVTGVVHFLVYFSTVLRIYNKISIFHHSLVYVDLISFKLLLSTNSHCVSVNSSYRKTKAASRTKYISFELIIIFLPFPLLWIRGGHTHTHIHKSLIFLFLGYIIPHTISWISRRLVNIKYLRCHFCLILFNFPSSFLSLKSVFILLIQFCRVIPIFLSHVRKLHVESIQCECECEWI